MNEQLKMLATSHHDGNLTWWLMSYATPKANRIIREFEAVVPRDQWSTEHNTFIMLEARAVDIEFRLDGISREESGLLAYWKSRNGSVKANWELFETVIGADILNRFWLAYDAANGSSLAAPADVQTENESDPNE